MIQHAVPIWAADRFAHSAGPLSSGWRIALIVSNVGVGGSGLFFLAIQHELKSSWSGLIQGLFVIRMQNKLSVRDELELILQTSVNRHKVQEDAISASMVRYMDGFQPRLKQI